ncbi:MAG: enoyl-CoA hydratase/isomerase family protein [Flavobacteriaceae bacterium]
MSEHRTLPSGRLVADIRLNAPARCNSLEPQILEELEAAFAEARDAAFIALSADGRHFSTGGDVAAFYQSRDRRDYAGRLVGRLQKIVSDMLTSDAIIIAAAQGATTGGAAGLLFAADIVIMSEDAFLQPYYAEVGFAPDGGWCALLPERIGAPRALAVQIENRRIQAKDALAFGIANRVVPAKQLQTALAEAIDRLDADHSVDAMVAAKRLIWDEARLERIANRLAAEHAAFCAEIVKPGTELGMARFLNAL